MTRIAGFDSIRAFAVTLVIARHVEVITPATLVYPALNGQTGVRVFFVLSGFLITTLLMREHAATGRISRLNFMARRTLRIMPLYFLATAVALIALTVAGGSLEPTTIALVLTYTYNFATGNEAVHFFNHYWSLSVEEHFYLVWPTVMVLAYGHSRRLLQAGCVVFVVLSGGFLVAHWNEHWTVPAAFPIAVGCWAALTADDLRRFVRPPAALIWSLALLMAPIAVEGPLGDVVSAVGGAGVLLWVFHNQDRTVVQRMDWGPIGYLGMISYGLYIWQGIWTGNGLDQRPFGAFPPGDPVVCIALTVGCAVLSWHLYERPILGLRDRFRVSP